MIVDNKRRREFDTSLLAIMIAIFVIGLLSIHSATQARNLALAESYVMRQASWLLIGILVIIFVTRVSYQKFIDLSYILYAANVVLLVLVLALGHVRLGAQRWFAIGNFAFQPSEFMKLTFILALSNYVGQKKDTMGRLSSLFVPSVMLAVPFTLVLLQPDLGTALLMIPIFFAILFAGGAKPKYLGLMIAAGVVSLPFFWHFLRDYQKQRLLVFINPNIDPLGAGYTIIQSKIAVGSGGLIGKGWLNGTQTQLNFLPERHTDFIFSVIGEEWGFLGSAVLVLLYFLVVHRALIISALTSDRFGKFIAIGIAVLVTFQVTINIGMTIGLMPVVGIPLPLVSYGGSSLIATMAAIGLVLNVYMRRSTF